MIEADISNHFNDTFEIRLKWDFPNNSKSYVEYSSLIRLWDCHNKPNLLRTEGHVGAVTRNDLITLSLIVRLELASENFLIDRVHFPFHRVVNSAGLFPFFSPLFLIAPREHLILFTSTLGTPTCHVLQARKSKGAAFNSLGTRTSKFFARWIAG